MQRAHTELFQPVSGDLNPVDLKSTNIFSGSTFSSIIELDTTLRQVKHVFMDQQSLLCHADVLWILLLDFVDLLAVVIQLYNSRKIQTHIRHHVLHYLTQQF